MRSKYFLPAILSIIVQMSGAQCSAETEYYYPRTTYMYGEAALSGVLKDDGAFRLVCYQTPITAYGVNEQYAGIVRAIREKLLKTRGSAGQSGTKAVQVDLVVCTQRTNKVEPFRRRDLGAVAKFFLGTTAICEFEILPVKGKPSKLDDFAAQIVARMDSKLLASFDSVRKQSDDRVKNLIASVRAKVPSSVKVAEGPDPPGSSDRPMLMGGDDPSLTDVIESDKTPEPTPSKSKSQTPELITAEGNEKIQPSLVMAKSSGSSSAVRKVSFLVMLPEKASPADVNRACSIATQAQRELGDDVEVYVQVNMQIAGLSCEISDGRRLFQFISDEFLKPPYLMTSLSLVKQALRNRKDGIFVKNIPLGDGKAGTVMRTNLLIDRLTHLSPEDDVTLYSLEPTEDQSGFHGWKILGKLPLNSLSKASVCNSISAAVPCKDLLPGSCFIPRHGLRITRAGKSVDFVICFQCKQMVAISEGATEFYEINDRPKKGLNSTLAAANIKLAKEDGPAFGIEALEGVELIMKTAVKK